MIASNREHCEAAAPPAPSRVRPRDGNAAARAMLIGLLIGVSAVVAAALYAAPREPMSLHGLAFFGVALGQVAIVIAWAVVARRFWLIRMAAALAAVAGFAVLLPGHFDVPGARFLGFLLLHGLGIAVPLAGMRLAGLRLQVEGEPTSLRAVGREAWRYSLAGLFAITTAVAVLAALMRAAELPGGGVIILGYWAAFVLVSLLAMAPLLAPRQPAWWGLLALPAIGAAPVLGGLAGAMETAAGMGAWLSLCQACYLVAATWVLRAAGYRALWSDTR